MKLDTKALRYLTPEDWRVLTAVETGSRNHEVVPTPLIAQISCLRGSSAVHRSISNLAKVNLIARVPNAKYDGYRLTYGGLDYLALHTHLKRQTLYSTGTQIGTGKESDIHAVASPSGVQYALKIHRLGRISFRSVKTNRDYLRHRNNASWLYMSRLAALKEYAFLTALSAHGFPVPQPVAQNRHTLVMELVQALPLRQVSEVLDPAGLYAELLELILRLADYGLIHGDFNEFNILLRDDEISPSPSSTPSDSTAVPTTEKVQTPILIDFPQMVSIDHANAEVYFARDVDCIKRFFARRFHFTSDEPGPFFADACARARRRNCTRLDVEVEASGFSRKMARELDKYMHDTGRNEAGDDVEIEDDVIVGDLANGDEGSEAGGAVEGDGLADWSGFDRDKPASARDIAPAASGSGSSSAPKEIDAGTVVQPALPVPPDISTLANHLSAASL